MAIKLGSAYGKVDLDASGVQRGVATAKTSLQGLAMAGEKVGAAMKAAGTMMTIGLTLPILAIGAASVKAASDLEETRNKVKVVFGDMSDSVLKWGNDSATAFGMSKQQALEAAGTFGNLFTSMGVATDESANMSEGLVQMAADLASFNNIDPGIVLEKLRSGLVGEVEPLRALGVNLTMAATKAKAMEMGLASASGEITQAALVQARYALILEQTTNAQGDFARTSDGLANSTRIMKAEVQNALAMLGENLLPVVLSVVQGLNKMLEAFNNMPPFMQKAVIAFGVFLALLGPLLSFIGTIVSLVSTLAGLGITLPMIGAALASIGTIITGTVLPAIGALIAALLPVLLPILLIVGAVALLYWAFKTNFMGITTTAKQLWFIIKYEFNQGWEYVKTKSAEGMESLQTSWASGWEAFKLKLDEGIAGWKLALTTIWQWIVTWVRSTVDSIRNGFNVDWSQIGTNIINGIINGLRSMWDSLVALAQEIAQSVLDAFDAVLDMGSPSKAMAKRGVNSALGYMQGMRTGMNPAEIMQLAAIPLQAMSGAGGNQSNMTINLASGLTMRQASQMIESSQGAMLARITRMLEAG